MPRGSRMDIMRSSALLLALAIPPLAATTASAGPIRVTFEKNPGLADSKTVSALIPDDFASAGLGLTLDTTRASRSGPPPGPGEPPRQGELLGSIRGLLTFDREPLGAPPSSPLPDSPAIWLDGTLSGISWDPGYGGLSGQWDGAASSFLTMINSTSPHAAGPADYERWERDLGITRALLDQFLAPGALKLSGSISGGRDNILPINLIVAPAPVPEPASWAAWALAASGAWAWRRRRAVRAR